MAVVGVHVLGAAGQVLSGRVQRLALGAAWRPAAAGVQVVSGVLAGPPNTQGELSLAGGVLTVQPFRAVIQSAIDATAGSYLVPNDAPVTFQTTAQHASQFRRSLVVVRVDDSQTSGVASSSTTDRPVLEVLDGGLAASAGATVLPAPAGSWLALGEVLIPPIGQTVTVTPYNPRTTTRGGVLPVIADGSAITGHDGALPTYDGQPRWHPTRGFEIGVGGAWGPPAAPPVTVTDLSSRLNAGLYRTDAAFPLRGLYYAGRAVFSGAFTSNVTPFNAGAGASFAIFAAGQALPAALIPTYAKRFAVACLTGATYSTAIITVNTDGTISYVPQAALTAGFSIYLDDVSYPLGY